MKTATGTPRDSPDNGNINPPSWTRLTKEYSASHRSRGRSYSHSECDEPFCLPRVFFRSCDFRYNSKLSQKPPPLQSRYDCYSSGPH